VGGGNPGDAGPAAGDHKEARERYRNALFDREAWGGSGAGGFLRDGHLEIFFPISSFKKAEILPCCSLKKG